MTSILDICIKNGSAKGLVIIEYNEAFGIIVSQYPHVYQLNYKVNSDLKKGIIRISNTLLE